MRTSTTAATVLTSPGAGAVAAIDVSSLPADKVSTIFAAFSAEPARNLAEASVGRIVFGRWDGEDLVVVRTAETRWEIHCHGGRVAIDRVLSQLESAGVVIERQPTFGPRNEANPIAEQIQQTLIRCRTRKTAGLVLAQLDGRLQRLYSAAHSAVETERAAALKHIHRWKRIAKHLIRPWRIAIAGPPNAGKSSLINCLAGLDRSIVSSAPGTTRDVVEVEIIHDGWMFQLVDTAGVRDSADSSLERIGIQQSLITLHECDLVCAVIDLTNPHLQPSLLNALQRLRVPRAVLYNKCDLTPLNRPDLHSIGPALLFSADRRADSDIPLDAVFRVSAVTGEGLPEFLQWMVRTLIPEEPTAATALPLIEDGEMPGNRR